MPTIDGGHIFLTLLAPVTLGETEHPGGGITTHSHLLREELANLPTAAQSPVAIDTGLDSPFACCTRTHFVRLFVIDQPMFNGRDPMNPLLSAATGLNPLAGAAAKQRANPLIHQPFDVLSRPWLVLSADIDRRPAEADNGIASWAEGLWAKSEPAIRAVFGHCHGFEAVTGGAAFADYVKRCQIETTMSFNDYWEGRPPLKGASIGQLALIAVGVAVLFAILLSILVPTGMLGSVLFFLLGLVPGIALALWRLGAIGKRPFPPAPNSDLPSVLKSLHVQQRFAFFAETVQGMAPEALHRSFGQFLTDVRPEDLASPTQVPGVIRSDGVQLLEHKAVTPKRAVL